MVVLSGVDEIIRKFDDLESSMNMHLGKVDKPLIVDIILRQKSEKTNNLLYTLEVFIKPNQDTQAIRNRIVSETGMSPAFYDQGTHIVVAHKLDFKMLKMINDIDFVERIRGTYVGAGGASIGATYDR